jgi:site-specific DNA-adenine methylase
MPYDDLGNKIGQCKIEGRDATQVLKPFIGRQGSKKELLRCLFDVFPPAEEIDVFVDLFMGSGVVSINWVKGLDVMRDGSISKKHPKKKRVIKSAKDGSIVIANDLASAIPLSYEKFTKFTDKQLEETAKLYLKYTDDLQKRCEPNKKTKGIGSNKEMYYYLWTQIFGKNPKGEHGGIFRLKNPKDGKIPPATLTAKGEKRLPSQDNGCGRAVYEYELRKDLTKKQKEKAKGMPDVVRVGHKQKPPDSKLYRKKETTYRNKMEEGIPHTPSESLTPQGVVNLTAASLGSMSSLGHGFVYGLAPIPLDRLRQLKDVMSHITFRNESYEVVLREVEKKYSNKKIFVFADPPYPDVQSYFSKAGTDLYGARFDQQNFEKDMYDFGVKTGAKICITNGNPDPDNKQFTGPIYEKIKKEHADEFVKDFIADMYAKRTHNGKPYWHVYKLKVSAKRNVKSDDPEAEKNVLQADRDEVVVTNYPLMTTSRSPSVEETPLVGATEPRQGQRQGRKCSVCKQPGHTKRTCPQSQQGLQQVGEQIRLARLERGSGLSGGGPWGDIIRLMLNKYRNYVTGH